MTSRRLLPAVALALFLAACGDDATPEEGQASGEVLEGTISDAMLPLEQVRSQAPLADPADSSVTSAASGSAAAPAEDPPVAAEAEPEAAAPEAED